MEAMRRLRRTRIAISRVGVLPLSQRMYVFQGGIQGVHPVLDLDITSEQPTRDLGAGVMRPSIRSDPRASLVVSI